MLHVLEIENFKGIARRQRVEFAPITLLFGANSAGKSTVLHALALVHELLVRGDADVDRTQLGGDVLELGGFGRWVYRHDTTRVTKLRVGFATSGGLNRWLRNLEGGFLADLEDSVTHAWLELCVEKRNTTMHAGPQLARAMVGVGDDPEPLVWLETGATLRDGEPLLARVNLGHDAFRRHLAPDEHDALTQRWLEVAVADSARRRMFEDEGGGFGDPDAIPPSVDGMGFGDGRALPVFAVARSRPTAVPSLDEPVRVLLPGGDEPTADQAVTLTEISTFLELIVQGTTARLVSHLQHAVYLGPLRAVPPRGFLYERAGRSVRWADGLAAWDLLLADRGQLVADTNTRLRRIDAGCQVEVQHLVDAQASAEDISTDHVDAGVRRLLLRAYHRDETRGALALPGEVGAGIAQVLPVIVAALAPRVPFAMIEQPELHVHPRLQTELGDLFIEASTSRQLLIETHSEHLILRLLRRIRETTENELPTGAPRFSPERLSVMYVERGPTGARFRRLRVDETGEFVDRWPSGFFAERAAELF